MASPASSSSSSSTSSRNPFRVAALVLLTVALVLSAYLVYASLSAGKAAGCDAGNCGIVLGSKWAKVFGVPVGLFGSAGYLVLILLGTRPFAPGQRGARTAGAALALLIPAAALWFLALQAFVIHAYCPWCCTTHAIASVGAILMILAWRRDQLLPPPTARGRKVGRSTGAASAAAPVWGAATALTGVAMAGFLTAQVLSPEPPRARPVTATMAATPPTPPTPPAVAPTTSTAAAPAPSTAAPSTAAPTTAATTAPPVAPPAATPAGPRRLTYHEGRFSIDPHAYPCNGSPDAEHLAVMVSDYTCPHCRAAYRILHEVRETFDGHRLGFVMLPSHHGGDSLDLQILMLTAWRLDPQVWSEVSSDLYLERLPLKPDAIRPILNQRIGAERFEPALKESRPWIQTVFDLTRDLHAANKARTGSGSIPQLVLGTEIVVGSPVDATDLFRLLEKNFGLVRQDFPALQLTRTEVDLGRVFAGTGPTVTVPYSNSGQSRLIVSRATVPQGGRTLRGLQVPVEAGNTGSVDLAIAVPRNPGPFEQIVTLFSNSRAAEHLFTVKGTSWKPIRAEPTILDLGRVEPHTASPTQAVMRIELDEPAKLQSVTSQNPGFTAVLREVTASRSYEILVSPTPSLPNGPHQTTLMVALQKPVPTGWPENLAFAARAIVEAAVTAIPQRVLVPAGALTSERHLQILVRCSDATPGFTVESATLDGGPAETQTQPKIASGAKTNEFLVRFSLPIGWSVPPPPLETRLTIRTSHPRFPTLSVPIASQGR